MKNTGTENYGGPIVTAGGLVFIGATNYDSKFRAFDKDTGKLLWETTLPSCRQRHARHLRSGREAIRRDRGRRRQGSGGRDEGSLHRIYAEAVDYLRPG